MGKWRSVFVVFVLLSMLVFAAKTSDFGLPSNTARIFEINNDGRVDALAFADKIDTSVSGIRYYQQQSNGLFSLNQTIGSNLARCGLSYADANSDGNIEVAYVCFNGSQSKEIVFSVLSFDDSFVPFSTPLPAFDNISGSLTTSTYGDLLFLDFNNDGAADILSCFLTEEGDLSLLSYNSSTEEFNTHESGIPVSRFNVSGSISSCYLLPLDFDNDGDLDIIGYTYDASNFTLYNNSACSLTSCSASDPLFQAVDPAEFINMSFFNSRKIKNLKAFDDGDGFADLYYVVDDDATQVSGTHSISFGSFKNNHYFYNHSASISIPAIHNMTFYLAEPSLANYSYYTYSNISNYFSVSIAGSGVQYYNGATLLRNETNAVYYNYELLNSTNGTVITGAQFVNNYDYNTGLGNLLTRKNMTLVLPNQCYHAKVQAIAPNYGNSSWSLEYNYSSSTEYCDGLDNDCDGRVDESFNVTWPDAVKTVISFDADGDGHVPQYKTYAHSNVTENWSVTFNCTPKKLRESSLSDALYYDPDDNDASVFCSGNNVNCRTNSVVDSAGGGGASGAGASPFTTDPHPQDKPPVVNPPVVTSPSTTQEKVTSGITSNRITVTRDVQYINGRTIVKESLKNVDLYPSNVTLRLTIPKEIIEDASLIRNISPYSIIQFDPVIEFSLGEIGSFETKVVQYSFNYEVSESLLAQINYALSASPVVNAQEKIQETLEQINETERYLNVTQTSEVIGNETIYTIDLNLQNNASLYNVSIYQDIPKCLIQAINEQIAVADRDFEIVEEDPLIVWHFDSLIDSQKIQLAIKAVADEDCRNQASTLSLAQQIVAATAKIDYWNLFFALLVIPIIAGIILLISEFSNIRVHEDEKIATFMEYVKLQYKHGVSAAVIEKELENRGATEKEARIALNLNAKSAIHFWAQKFDVGMHEMVLVLLLLFDFSDYFGILEALGGVGGDLLYFKSILSWVLLGYLLYHISISEIITGIRRKGIDVLLIGLFFIMTIKNLVGVAKSVILHSSGEAIVKFAYDFYNFILINNRVFEVYLFVAGLIGVFFVALYLAKQEPKAPSVLHAFLKHHTFLSRFLIIHLSLLGFFIVVFNLMFEWLAIAVDSFIVVATVIIVIAFAIKHHKKLFSRELVEEVSMDSENLYEGVLSLFHYKKFLPLAFSAMLILYVLTEIANFVIPYMTGMVSILYFSNFDASHTPLFNLQNFFDPALSLFAVQTAGLTLAESIAVGLVYVLNCIALIYLLFLPVMTWYYRFKQKDLPIAEVHRFHLSPFHIGIFATSLLVFLVRPVFNFSSLTTVFQGTKTLVGVDITTQTVLLQHIFAILFVALGAGILFWLLSRHHQKGISNTILNTSFIFFAYYMYLFVFAQFGFYWQIIVQSITTMGPLWLLLLQWIIGLHFILFAILSFALLYGVGFLTVLYFYIPKSWRIWLIDHLSFLKSQNFHHTHHFEGHDEDKHGTHQEHLVEYITKSIASGHELYVIVEHLEEQGWPLDIIEKAVHEAIPEKKLKKGLDHFKHYHHNKVIIHGLRDFIAQNYKNDLQHVIDTILRVRFLPSDVVSSIKVHYKVPRQDIEYSKEFAPLLSRNLEKLSAFVKEAEKKKYPKAVIFGACTFISIDKTPLSALLDSVVEQKLHTHEKASQLVDELLSFKYTEDDIRVALRTIKAKNKQDEEIMRYL